MADKALCLLSEAAQSLECAQRYVDDAATLLRLASARSEVANPDTASALALCERAHNLSRSEDLRYETGLECRLLRVRQGLHSLESLLPNLAALSEGAAPATPGSRSRLLIKLADRLLGSHPLAPGWLLQGAAMAAENGQNLQAFRARMSLASHFLARADRAQAEQHALIAAQIAQQMGFAVGGHAARFLQLQILTQQGNRDQALLLAGQMSDALGQSVALAVYGAPLATLLAQLGAGRATNPLLQRLGARLRHTHNPKSLAEMESAKAACALASEDHSGAARHHQRARHLYRLDGNIIAAAQQSLALTQLAFIQLQAGGKPATFEAARLAAHADLDAVPAHQLLPMRAALAQIEGQALALKRAFAPSNARLLEARKIFDALEDWRNAAFVEGLRGVVLLQAGLEGDLDCLRAADDAFCRARMALDGNLPNEASTMTLHRATAQIELASRTPSSEERKTLINQACALLTTCWHQMAKQEAANPLTFDLGASIQNTGGILSQRLHGLAQRLEELDCDEAHPNVRQLRYLLDGEVLRFESNALH